MAIGKEALHWSMTFMNSVHSFFDTIGKAHENMPETWKQKLPGFLGLSLEDERIFNGLRGQLTVGRQDIITRFLCEKCEDYERNRFINVVAGMEVDRGTPEESEKKYNKDGTLIYEKNKSGTPGIDCRLGFLNSFADILLKEYNSDLDKAYKYCIAGRMIMKNPLHRQILRTFSKGRNWFKRTFLDPLKAESLDEFIKKTSDKLSAINDSLETESSDKKRQRKPFWKNHH